MPPDQKPALLALDLICTDGGTQARVCLNDDVVAEYAEVLRQDGTGADTGQLFPAVAVCHDCTDYWLGDGLIAGCGARFRPRGPFFVVGRRPARPHHLQPVPSST